MEYDTKSLSIFRDPASCEIPACQMDDGPYPKRFAERKGLLEKFSYKGDISFLIHVPAVAVMGSRDEPKHAIVSGYKSGQYAALEGYFAVKGPAIGCDTATFRGALSEGGRGLILVQYRITTRRKTIVSFKVE